jgi:hypothetical protein
MRLSPEGRSEDVGRPSGRACRRAHAFARSFAGGRGRDVHARRLAWHPDRGCRNRSRPASGSHARVRAPARAERRCAGRGRHSATGALGTVRRRPGSPTVGPGPKVAAPLAADLVAGRRPTATDTAGQGRTRSPDTPDSVAGRRRTPPDRAGLGRPTTPGTAGRGRRTAFAAAGRGRGSGGAAKSSAMCTGRTLPRHFEPAQPGLPLGGADAAPVLAVRS